MLGIGIGILKSVSLLDLGTVVAISEIGGTRAIPLSYLAFGISLLMFIVASNFIIYPRMYQIVSVMALSLYIGFFVFRTDYMPKEIFTLFDVSIGIVLVIFFYRYYVRYISRTKMIEVDLSSFIGGILSDPNSLESVNTKVVKKGTIYKINVPKEYELEEGEEVIQDYK